MATITKTLLKRIAADLAGHPLRTGEFRPIAKMGAYYISRESAFDGLKWLFTMEIDGQNHYIFYAPACRATHDD